ncbi:hypothetical protein [Nonomuraea endophytica]|uniref:Uncharacterized protein n=1 Tax=Nonomuraea endophytica TaxID=714136 RepID=A0A7W7ZWT8_9ACTN|nr:hypothetical protein [Nonomuraea endophytica]MBB5075182.1 hypothetical protein [Nonomuraea endophytica]
MDDSWQHLVMDGCLLREGGQELPIIVLLGPAGTGKGALVRHVRDRVVTEPASPAALVSLRDQDDEQLPVSRIVARVAHGLMLSSRVKLPRVVFTLHVLALRPGRRSDQAVLKELDGLVDGTAPNPPEFLDPLRELLGMVPQIGQFLAGGVSLLRLALLRKRIAVRLLNRKGRTWLTAELHEGNLVTLAKRNQQGGADLAEDSPAVILCKALVADLREEYTKPGRHPRNCLLMLEGAETERGQVFLKALKLAKGDDPLVVVATSRSWVPVGGAWARPGLGAPDRPQPPTLSEAAHSDWLAHRSADEDRWWYPVRMPPLLTSGSERRHAAAIDRLTGGYRQAALELLGVAGSAPDDDAFRSALHRKDVLRWPERLHLPNLGHLSGWAAARHVEDAENALGGPPNLRDLLGDALWLRHDGELGTVIHPWLKRLLLHRLSEEQWDRTHELLESFCHDREGEVYYHALARVRPGDAGGHLARVTAWLDRRFDELDARRALPEWIAQFNLVTTAPSRLPLDQGLEDLHDSLVTGAEEGPDDWRARIRTLVVDRWFWNDPLLDPSGRRREDIWHGLMNLREHSKASRSVLKREADRYVAQD